MATHKVNVPTTAEQDICWVAARGSALSALSLASRQPALSRSRSRWEASLTETPVVSI